MADDSGDLVESFSGIRGIFGKGLIEDLLVRYLVAYFAIFPKAKARFLVAGDTRPSTKLLKEAALKTLALCAVKEVIDCGIVPVQVAELAILNSKSLGGLYITASHNEPEYNGFKFLKEDGAILYKEQAEALIIKVHGPVDLCFGSAKPLVVFRQHEAILGYADYLLEKIGEEAVQKIKHSHLRILVDPNGGSAIGVLPLIFEEMGVEAEIINTKPGVFNRLIEPNSVSLAPLASKLQNSDFQFACGFDCDADRVELILGPTSNFAKEAGPVVNGNYTLALACDSLLAGTKNQVVPVNDVSSYLIREVIKKHHATISEVEVGETNVVAEMERKRSIIGGEGSNGGVIVFPIKCRDGIMTIALLLKMLAQQKKTLNQILEAYPKFFSSHHQIACLASNVLQIKTKLERYYQGKGFIIKKTGDETGGLKALLDENSFVWFRQSKTQPGAFRVYAETDQSQQKADNLAQEGLALFEQFQKI